MMNPEPENTSKKTRTGPGWFRAWLILLAVLFIIMAGYDGMTGNLGPPRDWWLCVPLALLASAVMATIVLGVWRFARWLLRWRNFKRFLFGVACFMTLVALLYVEEDWRAKHAWEKFKREWEAKGEKFEYASVVPPPVPDDENFALTPIVYSSYGQMPTRNGKEIPANERDTNWVNRLNMPVLLDYADWPTNGGGHWEKGTLTDLRPWQEYYRQLAARTNFFPVAPQPQTPAQDVLTALSKYDAAIEELRAASRLPYSRFPIDYDQAEPAAILLPHLATMKGCSQILQLRATAELQDGQSQKALDDVKLMLYLTQSMRTEPVLVSHLVRLAMAAITLQPIYEGLAQHQWSDAQLAELDAELAKMDFLADYEFAMRGEMMFGISETEYWRRSRNFQVLDYDENGRHSSSASQIGFRLVPASFFYRNELTIAQMHERWTLPLADVENRVVSPTKVNQSIAAGDQALRHGWPYNIFARLLFPALGKVVIRYAREQSCVDLARVAIALERYRLAHGEYPESLDALAPRFMERVPHDIIGGQPLHYRRTADGLFVLYSVGWNETDDGGQVDLKKGGTVDINQGDWVWRYPAR